MDSPYDNSMPTSYDTPAPVANSNTTSSSVSVADTVWVKSIASIFKIVQCILSLIAFICAAIKRPPHQDTGGAGWIEFVSMFALILTLLDFFLWLFRVVPKIPPKFCYMFIEFFFYVTMTVFYFIAGVVAAAFGNLHPSLGAAAFFCFASMCLYGTDVYFTFQRWRTSGDPPYCGRSTGGGGASGGGAAAAPPPPQVSDKGPQY